MPTVSDDKRPMTGTWYRSTIDPDLRCKVIAKDFDWVSIVITGGITANCTINEFAEAWELS